MRHWVCNRNQVSIYSNLQQPTQESRSNVIIQPHTVPIIHSELLVQVMPVCFGFLGAVLLLATVLTRWKMQQHLLAVFSTVTASSDLKFVAGVILHPLSVHEDFTALRKVWSQTMLLDS